MDSRSSGFIGGTGRRCDASPEAIHSALRDRVLDARRVVERVRGGGAQLERIQSISRSAGPNSPLKSLSRCRSVTNTGTREMGRVNAASP